MNDGLPPKAPKWGKEYKQWVAQTYTRSVLCFGHTTSLPVESNSISLDPTVKDAWGVPAIRMTYTDHPQDLKLYKYFAERSEELLHASGAAQTWLSTGSCHVCAAPDACSSSSLRSVKYL